MPLATSPPSSDSSESANLGRTSPGRDPITTVRELRTVVRAFSDRWRHVGFQEAVSRKYCAADIPLPASLRFDELKLAHEDVDIPRAIVRPQGGMAGFALSFPVHIAVTDAQQRVLPGKSHRTAIDSPGYVLFQSELERQTLRIRPSGARFPCSSVVPPLSRKGIQARRLWAKMFHLSTQEAGGILQSKAAAVEDIGDNHILLLVRAFLTFFDAIASTIPGVEVARDAVSSEDIIVDVTRSPGWSQRAILLGQEPVNVIGGSRSYQEFWAHCCFDRPPAYAVFRGAEGRWTSTFSNIELARGSKSSLVCLCDCQPYGLSSAPAFFARPGDALDHIQAYVTRYGLWQQAREALQIASVWPTLSAAKAHIAFPAPCHTSDWLSDSVAPGNDSHDDMFTALRSSSPYLTLAAILASASTLRGQLYDYVSLFRKADQDWLAGVRRASQWFATELGSPGSSWSYALQLPFHTSPSLLFFTGLDKAIVDWPSLFGALTDDEESYPAHLRLLQRHFVASSVSSTLPWRSPWLVVGSLSAGLFHATESTLLRLTRLRLLPGPRNGRQCDRQLDEAHRRSPVNHSSGWSTAPIDAESAESLRHALLHGVRSFATLRFGASVSPTALGLDMSSRDPVAAERTCDPFGGLLCHRRLTAAQPDALAAPTHYDHTHEVTSDALKAASSQVYGLQIRLNEIHVKESERCIAALASRARECYTSQASLKEAQGYGAELFSALETASEVHADQGSLPPVLHAVLWILRSTRQDRHSIASLLRKLHAAVGFRTRATAQLSPLTVAGICVILGLPVWTVCNAHEGMVMWERDDNPKPSRSFALVQGREGWSVRGDNNGPSAVLVQQATTATLSTTATTRSTSFSGNISPRGHVLPLRPRHNLPTRARLLDDAIRLFDWDIQSAQSAADVHLAMFPEAALPRFLRSQISFGPDKCEQLPMGDVVACFKIFLDARLGDSPRMTLQNFLDRYRDDHDVCDDRWPFRSLEHAPKNNLTVFDLLNMLDIDDEQEQLALWFLLSHQGNHGEFCASVALWLASVRLCPKAWHELLASGLLEADEDSWLHDAQKVHERWRKEGLLDCRCDGCWVQLLYTQNLWGRGGVEVDWLKELSAKSSPPDHILAFTGQHWSSGHATELVRESITSVLQTASKTLALMSFDDFMNDAYEWLVSGSAAGLQSAFKGTEVRDVLLKKYGLHPRPTKRSVMEKISRAHILDQLEQRPQIVAKLHQKLNETGGKARAIYGVTMWHYVFSNWLMAPFEKAIQHPYIDLYLRNHDFAALQARRIRGSSGGEFFSSYDYPDFNSMHSHRHMSFVYVEAKRIALSSASVQGWSMPARQLLVKGYDWLIHSCFTQTCFLPLTESFVQTVGGLFSGNRDTTLINTLMNIAYASVVDTSCRNMGLDPRVDWRLCHGDDIITQHSSYGAALAWNVVAQRANLKGQERKLLTDRSYHEYLRVMGCKDGRLRGSLARAVASFVCGNWETEQLSGLHAKVVEIDSSLATLTRRGLRSAVTPRLRRAVFRRIASHLDPARETSKRLRNLLSRLEVVTAEEITRAGPSHSFALDEVATRTPQDLSRQEHLPVDIGRTKTDVERLFLSLPDEVTGPYLQRLLSFLPKEVPVARAAATRLKMMLQRSTYGTELPVRFQLQADQIWQLSRLLDIQAQCIALRGRFVRCVPLQAASGLLGQHKLLAGTLRRIQAAHLVLAAIEGVRNHLGIIAHYCGTSEAMASNALIALNLAQGDWRRHSRPSASELCGLENELELVLTSSGVIQQDEEVVVVMDTGGIPTPMRAMLLY